MLTQEEILEKYPEIYFFLTYGDPTSFQLSEENPTWAETFDLKEIEILYVYGIGRGLSYKTLKGWLKEECQRRLIYLEDDLGALGAFFQCENASEIADDPQVLIHHLKNVESDLEELAQNFPCAHIQVAKLPSKTASKFAKIQLKLLRDSSAFHAFFSEALFSHKLLENLASNIQRLPQAFYANKLEGKYAGIPAIICGAGPSLKTAKEKIQVLQGKALVIAGGSTIAALSNAGVIPDLAMALDPNPEELQRLHASSAFEVPLLFASRLCPEVFLTCNGPIGYLKSDTGGLFESWMEEKLGIEGEAIGPDLGREAFSVTTLAVAFAYALGCNPIVLAGVDLAFTGNKRYCDGVVTQNSIDTEKLQSDKRAMEKLLRRKNKQGKMVYTLMKWVMESECLSAYAKAHPEREFFTATEEGIGFSHIPYIAWDEFEKKYCTSTYDFQGKIHCDIQNLKMDISTEQIATLLEELKSSLERALLLCDEILDEIDAPTAKMAALEMDLEQEIAYGPLLSLALPALDRLFDRYHGLDGKEKVKWNRVKEVIESQISILGKAEVEEKIKTIEKNLEKL